VYRSENEPVRAVLVASSRKWCERLSGRMNCRQ
jgi:hypothetical protein